MRHTPNNAPRTANGNPFGFAPWQWFAHILAAAIVVGMFL